MLKQRLITAVVLIPLVVASILLLPTFWIAVLFGIFALIGAWEWAGIMGLHGLRSRTVCCAVTISLMLLSWFALNSFAEYFNLVVYSAILWWICALILVVTFPGYVRLRSNRIFLGLAGLLIIIPCWAAMIALHMRFPDGPKFMLLLLVLVWVADSGAYFGGRRWGKNKLAEQVSPGKTWEGVISGAILATVVALAAYYLLGLGQSGMFNVLEFCLISAATVLLSVLGDLTESLFKRQAGIKDSGSILPGHGGVLDRIDSLTAAAPAFLLGMMLTSSVRLGAASPFNLNL